MDHVVAISVEIIFALVFFCVYFWRGRQRLETWARHALLGMASAFLCFGIAGIIIHWHLITLSSHQFLVLTSVRSGIGGIGIGFLLSLLLSGQMQKIVLANGRGRTHWFF